jgi:HSP20 family molecular chaperone IbpA
MTHIQSVPRSQGFDAKDLSVRAERNSVYIHGKSEQKKEEKKGKDVKYS